jgi:hypothetical protein
MTTYSCEIKLTAFQAEAYRRALRIASARGIRYADRMLEKLEAQMPGPARLNDWPHYFTDPVEWALDEMGHPSSASAIFEASLEYELAMRSGEQPTEAQALAAISVAAINGAVMTSTSSFCHPKAAS